MKRFHRAAIAALGVGVAALALALPARAQSGSPSPSGDQVVLRVGMAADLDTDNVWAVSGGSGWAVITAEYDMLR